MTVFGVVYPETDDLLTNDREWVLVRDAGGQLAVALWHEEDDGHVARVMRGEDGSHFYCLFGVAFSKRGNVPIGEGDLRDICAEGPAHLTANFWGDYLFISFDKAARRFLCCCDPSSQWAAYWSWSDRHGLMFTDTIACLHQALKGRGESPTWSISFFTTWLRKGSVQSGATAFDRISEVPPGCAVLYTHGRKPEMTPVWDPLAHAALDTTRDPFDILKSYLRLHVPVTDRPVVELSGGLESSSVLLALRAVSPGARPLSCAHHYSSEVGSSIELEHARRAAEHAGADLLELDVKALGFAPSPPPPRAAKPHMRHCMIAITQEIAGRLDEGEGSRMLNGHGGDALFLEPPPFGALADAALARKWRSLARLALDLALIRRATLAHVVSTAWKPLLSPGFSEVSGATFGLESDALRQQPTDGSSHLHPVLQRDNLRRLRLPGRSYQLLAAFSSLDEIRSLPFPFKKRVHYPFLCQPMVELALSIPSYRHFEGAHTRIILRRSVSAATGYPNLWRRDKGETSGMMLLGVRKHKDHVMSLCLEGFLARQGLLDRARTRAAIQECSKGRNDHAMDLDHIYAAELLVQGWQ
jgi:asparagine synthase (glutamine-hydrolysing)